jgi:hypothetical protein
MKKTLLILGILVFTFTGLHAQNNWTKQDKDDFISSCVENAKGMGMDSANRYCSCMMNVMMIKYPKTEEMAKLTAKDFETPAMKAEIKKCLTMRWPDADRKRFVEGCIGTAKEHLGEAKAKQYCDCMLGKMEVKFETAAEADNITAEELKKPEFMKMIRGCVPGN